VKLTIASVEAIALAAPFERMYGSLDAVPSWLLTPASSHRVLPRLGQYTTLVRIRTVDGLEGIGEAYGLPEPRVTATIIGKLLAPMLVGRDAGASEALWELMFGAQAGAGRTGGFYLEAISGVDLALWDLRGKAAGQPVHRLLGGPVRTTVPVYASPIPFLPSLTESAERALSFVEQGFKAVKLKLGRGFETDMAHAGAVAAALDGKAALQVDLNCAYDVKTAIRLGLALETLGVRWLEEPLATDDVAGLAEVRAAVRIPVVTGESEFIRYGYRDFLLHRAVDVVMPNLARAGGITEARRIAALCSAFHVDVSPHGVGSAVGLAAALQFAAATPNVPVHEYNRLPNPLRDDLAVTPFQLVDGELEVPSGPGLGVTLNEDLVAEYEVFRA
jgi:D-arabinonate dehydratase/D-galactarolactone cycloisomerase